MIYASAVALKILETITHFKTNYIHTAIRYYLSRQNPVIFEIGTHNGEDTIRFAKRYPNSKIYTFEPDPRLTTYLINKFRKWENIVFYPKAVYTHAAIKPFNLSPSNDLTNFKNTGSSSLLDLKSDSDKIFYKKVNVETINLNDTFDGNDERIDLIWIDIQGAEKQIVNAHKSMFMNCGIIWIEYGETDYVDCYTREELLLDFEDSHYVSFFSNRGSKGNLLLVKK